MSNTLSDARANAKPLLQGLTDDDLLTLVNELLAERKQIQHQTADGVAKGRDMYAQAHPARTQS